MFSTGTRYADSAEQGGAAPHCAVGATVDPGDDDDDEDDDPKRGNIDPDDDDDVEDDEEDDDDEEPLWARST